MNKDSVYNDKVCLKLRYYVTPILVFPYLYWVSTCVFQDSISRQKIARASVIIDCCYEKDPRRVVAWRIPQVEHIYRAWPSLVSWSVSLDPEPLYS